MNIGHLQYLSTSATMQNFRKRTLQTDESLEYFVGMFICTYSLHMYSCTSVYT